MSQRRKLIVDRILAERERQFNLPGSEWDGRNTPNDWVAIIASYVARGSSRKGNNPTAEDFEDDLVKAAAVILAALENTGTMRASGNLL